MKHKHAELMMQYAQDAMTTAKPWELWEINTEPHSNWRTLTFTPSWLEGYEYRRKPKQHTVTLNTDQLKEIIEACSYVGWENEDFATGVQVLQNALGGEV